MFSEQEDLPTSTLERAQLLESITISAATDGAPDNRLYQELRRELMQSAELRHLVPAFVRTNRDLSSVRSWAQSHSNHWAPRRALIAEKFTPLIDHLEGKNTLPGDTTVSDALQSFDADGVHAVWSKALARRATDAEGAITVARTLLETVCKRVLDDRGVQYDDAADLPKLYKLVAEQLNLAPSQHAEEPINAILGGAMNVVNGLGTLRNRLSDSHGRGRAQPVRPSPRHAALAVNMAGAMATFIVETHLLRLSGEQP